MRSHQEWKMRTAALVFALSIFGLPVLAAEEPVPPQAAAAEKKPAEPSERLQETTHTLRSDGASLSYRALAGEMVIRDASLPAAERVEIVGQLARFTGLPAEEIERRDLRVDHISFAELLLEGDRLAVGLLDSRYTGFVNALWTHACRRTSNSSITRRGT